MTDDVRSLHNQDAWLNGTCPRCLGGPVDVGDVSEDFVANRLRFACQSCRFEQIIARRHIAASVDRL